MLMDLLGRISWRFTEEQMGARTTDLSSSTVRGRKGSLAALSQQPTTNLIYKKAERSFRGTIKWLMWIMVVGKPTYLEKNKSYSSGNLDY